MMEITAAVTKIYELENEIVLFLLFENKNDSANIGNNVENYGWQQVFKP